MAGRRKSAGSSDNQALRLHQQLVERVHALLEAGQVAQAMDQVELIHESYRWRDDSWMQLHHELTLLHAPPQQFVRLGRMWIRESPQELIPHQVLISALMLSGQKAEAERQIQENLPRFPELAQFLGPSSSPKRIKRKPVSLQRSLGQGPDLPAGRTGTKTLGQVAGKTAGKAVAGKSPGKPQAGKAPGPTQAGKPAGAKKTAEGPGPAATEASQDPTPFRPPLVPLPAAQAEATPVLQAAPGGMHLLQRLLRGEDDGLGALLLARRSLEVLTEDSFDRLLALDHLRGVQQLGYQIETALRVLKRFHGRVLLADEVGLGKTIEASLVLGEYLLRGLVRRALILVPSALVGQWQEELASKFGIASLTTQDEVFRSDPEQFWTRGPVLVASLGLARTAPHRDRVLAQRYDLVIVDEAHHIKNRATRSWELVNGLRSRFFLMLTATPVETHLGELYNLVTLLRPGTLGTEADFRRRFVKAGDPTQPRDPEQLRELLREVMIRNTRAVCGVMLPPRTVRTLVVEPRPEEKQAYALLVEQARQLGRTRQGLTLRLLMEEAGSSPQAAGATATRLLAERGRELTPELDAVLRQVARLAVNLRVTTKLERLAELIPGGKVLIFSRFLATLEAIAADLGRRGIPFATFHGGMSSLEKDRAVAAFAQTPGPEVLLCSEIGGEGRNLQFCHRLINFDLPWNPMKIEQRIGRIHRIGQQEAVEVVNLATAGSAEERILDVLDRRVNLFELVVGEMDLVLGELTDEREFGDRVFDIYSGSKDELELEAGFDELADQLLSARRRVDRTRKLDETLFNEGYEA